MREFFDKTTKYDDIKPLRFFLDRDWRGFWYVVYKLKGFILTEKILLMKNTSKTTGNEKYCDRFT